MIFSFIYFWSTNSEHCVHRGGTNYRGCPLHCYHLRWELMSYIFYISLWTIYLTLFLWINLYDVFAFNSLMFSYSIDIGPKTLHTPFSILKNSSEGFLLFKRFLLFHSDIFVQNCFFFMQMGQNWFYKLLVKIQMV